LYALRHCELPELQLDNVYIAATVAECAQHLYDDHAVRNVYYTEAVICDEQQILHV